MEPPAGPTGPVPLDDPSPPPLDRQFSVWSWAGWLTVAYAAAALLGMVIGREPGSVAAIWFANAIGVAALATRPRRDWPLLLLAVGAANLIANLLNGDRLLFSLSFVPPNVLEVALGAWAVQAAGIPERGLRSPALLSRLLIAGSVLPPFASATLGTAMIAPHGLQAFDGVWLPWYVGSVIGGASVLPLAFLICRHGLKALMPSLIDARMVVLLPLAVGVTLLALARIPFPFVYLTLPLLLGAFMLPFPAHLLLTLAVSLATAFAIATGILVTPPRLAPWESVFIYMAYAAALVPPQLLAAAQAGLRDLNDRLAARQTALRRANEGLEQFVRIASHDLREPLNTVVQFGSLIELDESPRLSDDGRRYLALMLQATRRMRRLLDDVLLYARMQRGDAPLPQPVPLDPVFDELLLSLAASIRERGADVHVEPLPVVRGNAALLSLMFQNLLSNALKFVPEDRAPVVRVEARIEGGQALIAVADNGIGIPDADRAKLFQPFQRLHLRRRYEGTGLGLAIARQIIEVHGGAIDVESAPDRGSRFTVTLPLA